MFLKGELVKEIKKNFSLEIKYENTTQETLWDTLKAVLGKKSIDLSSYMKKEIQEKTQINELMKNTNRWVNDVTEELGVEEGKNQN